MDRFAIFLVKLDPTAGAETAKTRPCVIVSANELNRSLATVIIAPMTTVRRGWPTRIQNSVPGQAGRNRPRPDSHCGQDAPDQTSWEIGA
jgi:mRNA interferase MazF